VFEATLLGYLDPGSGSMLVQLMVGGLAGLGVFLKFYGRALWSLVTGHPPHEL
jgi:hypothetical protein